MHHFQVMPCLFINLLFHSSLQSLLQSFFRDDNFKTYEIDSLNVTLILSYQHIIRII